MSATRVDVPHEAHVIRFRPTEPAAVLHRAELEYRRAGVAGLSVFADVAKTDEDDQAVAARLIRAASLGGVRLTGNPKFYRTTAGALYEKEFTFVKDNEDEEPAEHYSVDLGKADLDNVVRFLEVFRGPEATWLD